MGGIQSVSALPGDPTFSQFDNKYDVASYKRICAEFGVDPSSDFRFTTGANHGLGNVYIWISGHGIQKTGAKYPDYDKFSDEGGTASKGLSRVNQSIEAFVYCILGSQVNVRSSILGTGGRAKEAQSEFLVLVEDAIRQPDLAKSVQRYQLAIDEAKVRLNLAVCPGAWLMPARMVINTESVVGYNNQLKQAVVGMKLGVNDEVNKATKKVGATSMSGGPSKVNRPTSHSSNPIHKAAKKEPAPHTPSAGTVTKTDEKQKPDTDDTAHEKNKIYLIAGAVIVAFAVSRAL
ncbi:hypothetical protein ACROYT_G042102 [Oculina patagonica]